MKKLLLLSALLIFACSSDLFAQDYMKMRKRQLRIEHQKKLNFIDLFSGAISDYTKAIELDPNYRSAYKSRGITKEKLGDLNGACADWKKAARLGDADAAKWVANQCN